MTDSRAVVPCYSSTWGIDCKVECSWFWAQILLCIDSKNNQCVHAVDVMSLHSFFSNELCGKFVPLTALDSLLYGAGMVCTSFTEYSSSTATDAEYVSYTL